MTVAKSPIEWTDATWGPTRGCSRVSEGCRNCYAEIIAARFSGPGLAYEGLTRKGKWAGEVRLIEEALSQPLRWKQPRRIFVNSMSDLFHENVDAADIDRIFDVMMEADQHTYQILTKRPARMRDYITRWLAPALLPSILSHVWLGVSVEDQATADERIPLLLQTPAAVRWVSYEPALGPVDFKPWLSHYVGMSEALPVYLPHVSLDWVVVGGESGPGARFCFTEWIASTVAQCRASGVPCFVKQLGAHPVGPRVEGDNEYIHGHALRLTDRKGGDMDEWPEDLRVREFPQAQGGTHG